MQTKLFLLYRISFHMTMAIYLCFTRNYKLDINTWLQVDQTCIVGSNLARISRQRSFKELNQLDTSVMGDIVKNFQGVAPSHYGTKKLAIISLFLFYASIFEIEGHLKWRHTALGLMARI